MKKSIRASRNSAVSPLFEAAAALAAAAAVGGAALAWFFARGYLLFYGDAQAHLNIARRLFDTRTPNYEQIGTVWLPLPHWAMVPFVRNDGWWQSGLAGGIPASIAFALAGLFLFLAARRVWSSSAAGWTALAVFALNPNVLYLQSTAMTEAYFFAGLFGAVYFSVLARDAKSGLAAAAGGAMLCAATLTRYDGWFLIPFFCVYLLAVGRGLKLPVMFGLVASLGPLYWLAHNQYLFSDALEFYWGEWSARAIYARQLAGGMSPYAGDGDWIAALQYWGSAARLTVGWPLVGLGALGAVVAIAKRSYGLLLVLAALPLFYVMSMHSGGTPIFVPHLWPFSHYNTRYGLAALPFLAMAAAGLAVLAPARLRPWVVLAVGVAAVSPWLIQPNVESIVTWKESQVNSVARREWTRQAAEYMGANYRGGGIATSFGDLAAIFSRAGIPFREILHEGNEPFWQGAAARPELMLHEEWVVAMSGDKLATALVRAQRNGRLYERVKMIVVKGANPIEIYRHRPRIALETVVPQ